MARHARTRLRIGHRSIVSETGRRRPGQGDIRIVAALQQGARRRFNAASAGSTFSAPFAIIGWSRRDFAVRNPHRLPVFAERHANVLESEMAVPKRKTSPMKRGFRRSADALKQPTYIEDKDSGELRRPHHVDLKSGMYRGRMVLKPKAAAAEAD